MVLEQGYRCAVFLYCRNAGRGNKKLAYDAKAASIHGARCATDTKQPSEEVNVVMLQLLQERNSEEAEVL